MSGECFLINKNEMSFWAWGRSGDIYMWEIFTHNNLHIATIRKTHRSFSTHDVEFYARILLTCSKSFWYHEGTSKITLNYTQFLQFSGRISSMKKMCDQVFKNSWKCLIRISSEVEIIILIIVNFPIDPARNFYISILLSKW